MEQLDKIRERKITELAAVSIVAILTVCEERLKFGKEKMQKAAKEMDYAFDSISKKYVSFEDLKECLKDEGVDLPFDFEHKQICNTIDDAQRIVVYTEKAFACAAFCTVLIDKFLFKPIKAQQAVKQLCTLFDEFLNDRNRLKIQKERLYTEYNICVY